MKPFFEKSTFFIVDLIALSNLFVFQYDLDGFNILGIEEENAYVSKGIDNTELSEYEMEMFDNIIEQQYCDACHIEIILKKLCYDDVIESGDYLITNN